MGDPFDPYREALVIEQSTLWPEELAHVSLGERNRIEALLHARPQEVKEMAYLRLATGFHRQITVTPEDLHRLQ